MQALWWATDAQRVRRLWWTAALVGTGLVQVAVVAFVDGKSAVERWTPARGVVVSVLGLLSTLTQSETRTGEGGGADWLKARADALAGAVEDMWAAEARLRRLQDPEPLPVRWRPVDMPLADHDENVWRRSEAHAAFSLRGDRLAVLTRGAAATIAGSAASALLLMTTPDRYGMHGMSLQMALVMGPLALSLSAYGRLAVARIWLGATGRLPWRLMAFLNEAHTRGVLRQSGARYEFRHLRLQECLAPTPEPDGAYAVPSTAATS